MSIGKKIRELLKEHGMQSKELAEKIGIATSTLSELMNGKTKKVSIQNGVSIAKELGCSVEYLIDDNGNTPKQINSLTENDQALLARYKILDALDQASVLGYIDSKLEQNKYKEQISFNAIS